MSVVLLLPAAVALSLAGARVQAELAQADKLSAMRDQLPVLQDVADLARLVGEETAVPGSSPNSRSVPAQVDAQAAVVAARVGVARTSARADQDVHDALGQLGALRSVQARGRDVVLETSRYYGIVSLLSGVLPGTVSAAGDSGLDAYANAAANLLKLRCDLARQQALLRAATQATPAKVTLIAAVSQVAASVAATSDEVVRTLPANLAPQISEVASAAADRRTALERVLSGEAIDLASMIGPIRTELNALGEIVGGDLGSLSARLADLTNQTRSDALRDAAMVLGALLGALAFALYMARSLVRPIKRLHAAALAVAHHRLPDTVERMRSGEDVDWRSVEPVPVRSRDEVGQLARAFEAMQRQAVRLAGQQAELRRHVSDMFMALSRRSQSLVDKQLSVIEALEADEQDPRRLELLFHVDHIATRLRRNGENLQILARGKPVRHDRTPLSTAGLMRAAASAVKDYQRIVFGHAPSGAVRAAAAADVVHILAELVENATRFSAPENKVLLTSERAADGGLLIEVVDNGLGMATEDVVAANTRLAVTDADPETTRQMGLFVVGRLARPLGVTVRLRQNWDQPTATGITASVHIPSEIVVVGGLPPQSTAPAAGAPAQPDLDGIPRPVAGNDIEMTWPRNDPDAQETPSVRPGPGADLPAKTPIFDQLLSGWLVEKDAAHGTEDTERADHEQPAHLQNRTVPADATRRATGKVFPPSTNTPSTEAGLPIRKPGAHLAPGAAAPPTTARSTAGFRDPAVIRSGLARHSQGLWAARRRTAESPSDSGSGPRT
ncbi:HAMP domain-containing protein [Amycolatopsis sp. NPDC059021]|uniref:HAMP domain-containing protein n=1 Tax=Amycolatopsis sp. NPDC059021 TaxID=3346704 RepID=UPI00366B1D8B